jgi:hypothetical protein
MGIATRQSFIREDSSMNYNQLRDLAALMGNDVSDAEAKQMADLLAAQGYSPTDLVPDNVWDSLLDQIDAVPVPTVNETGLMAIQVWLSERMINGDLLGPDNIGALATEAEFQMGEGNPPCIELRAWESVSGHTEEFTIPADGITWR